MAKNKIQQWLTSIREISRIMPRDLSIKDTATIAFFSLWKIGIDASKNLATKKMLFPKPEEVQSTAKEVGSKAIPKIELPAPGCPKKTEYKPKSIWTFGGLFGKTIIRKPGSKQ